VASWNKRSASFLDKYEELDAKEQTTFTTIQQSIQHRHNSLQKIAAKIKKIVSKNAQIKGSSENVKELLEDVQTVMDDMRNQFKKAFQLIEQFKLH